MLESFVKFGFSAGVLDPKLHGRGDLKNYDLGLAEARNWCIDYLGGAFTRPGTIFRDYTDAPTLNARLIPFQFNNDIANSALIVITATRIRFMQDGNYILEPAKTISSLGATITSNAHGFVNDNWVKILGESYVVKNATANTFTLENIAGVPVNLSGTGATSVARIYTLASPYSAADLPLLKYDQDGDVIYLNHPNYAERKLVRIANDNWTISATAFNPSLGINPVSAHFAPTISAGTFGALYAILAVNGKGEEVPLTAGAMFLVLATVDFTAVAGSVTLRWSAPTTTGAWSYNIYRSLVVPQARAHHGMDLGYIGSSIGTSFTDNNIVPDFTRAPLVADNPFANAAIDRIIITSGGSGYDSTANAVAFGIVGANIRAITEDGAVRGVRILNRGNSGSSPGIDFFGGTGAAATITLTSASGNNPASSAKSQQRRVRGGTINAPLALFGSRVGQPDSYATTDFGRADDPYILSLDAATQTPIRHLVPATEGFFAFCDDSVMHVRGVDDAAITATTAKSSPQTAEGASHVKPLRIEREVLYHTSEFDSVVAIGPSNLPTYFTTVDRSVLASHYFSPNNPLQSMTWAKSPHHLIWASLRDGTFLSCAYLAEQEVFAWSNHTTAGQVQDMVTVREFGFDRVYILVRRGNQRFIERLTLQDPETEETMWAVDCGLRSTLTTPAASVTVSGLKGTVTITASSGIFGAGDVGKVFRAGGGRGSVVSSPSATQLIVELDIPIRQPIPEESTRSFTSGQWSLTSKFTTFSGLGHLEGREVEILADGAEVEKRVVTNGTVTLEEPASFVLAGLGFTGRLKTLPPSISGAVLENRAKNVKGLAVRLFKARGLRFGDGDGDVTYPLPTRTTEPFGVAPRFKNGLHEISIRGGYDLDGSIVVDKLGPQSASVLGLVMEVDIEG